LTTFTVTTGISAGGSYAFRVSAYNAYGWSTPSVSVNIVASTYPNKMNAPSTTIQDNTNIRISWNAAYSNSDPIVSYEVSILSNSNTYVIDSVYCGVNQAQIIANNFCDITM